jgi:hypothetical protein
VQVHEAGLAAEHAADPRFGGDAAELIETRLGGTMVGHGHLPHAHHLGDEGNVFSQAAGDGGERQLVGAAVDVGGDALVLELHGLGEQRLRAARDVVGPQEPQNRGDAGAGDLRKRDLRGPRPGPGFAAASQKVHVQIHEPRDDGLARSADDAGFEFGRELDLLGDARDDPPGDQDVPAAQLVRRINSPAGDEGEHGLFAMVGWKHG